MQDDYLLGTADLAAILGCPARTVQWLRTQDGYDFPPSEILVDKRRTWICRASTALTWAQGRGKYDGPIPDPMALPDLVSTEYVSELTGRKRVTVQAWQHKRELPEPAVTVSRTPCWLRSDIDAWWEDRKVPAA